MQKIGSYKVVFYDMDDEEIEIDEFGIEVCLVCDCAIEHGKCLCDMRGW